MATKPASYTDPAVVADLTAAAAANGGTDYKALVCIFLFGANDSHNTVVPTAASPNRAPYDTYRSNIGIAANAAPTNVLNTNWRLHPSLDRLKGLHDTNKLATLLNVGMLLEPVNRASYLAKSVKLPDQLFSHNSQQQQWQSLPEWKKQMLTGWFGRAASLAQAYYNPAPFQSLDCLYGVNQTALQMDGFDTTEAFSIRSAGIVLPFAGAAVGTDIITAGRLTAAKAASSSYSNVLQQMFAAKLASGEARATSINAQLQTLPAPAQAFFDPFNSGNALSSALNMVARVIHSRTQLAQRRQLFFVGLGGWDDHANLLAAHGPRLQLVDDAIGAMWDALGNLGLQNNVAIFTESDFGRALVQNGSGSDHGWGGHHFVVGGSVTGGIYGQEPDYNLGSSVDSGQGRLIPTTSVEQYAGTLLKWWGIPEQHLPLVLPNLPNFAPATLGFL